MLEFVKDPNFVLVCSLAGAVSAILGSLIAGFAFRGRLRERYSPLNHYISELGEQGISRLAWVFNLGLILCGLFLLPACIWLGIRLPGILARLGMVAGVLTALCVSAIGIFPMNKMTGHVRAAVTYFRAGLVMVILFTLAIAFQKGATPLLPRLYSLAGIPAILAYASFLLYSRVTYSAPDNANSWLDAPRPRLWWTAVIEWSVFLTSIPFFLAIALGL